MTDQIAFLNAKIPLVNLKDGTLTREGRLFLAGIFARIGGPQGPSIEDVYLANSQNDGNAEIQAQLAEFANSFQQQPVAQQPDSVVVDQIPPPIVYTQEDVLVMFSALNDSIAELTKKVESLQQGLVAI